MTEIKCIPITFDYRIINSEPFIRMWGKTDKGESCCAFFSGFKPYFYTNAPIEEIDILPEVTSSEEVEKYLPFGFQTQSTTLTKVFADIPSSVPKLRELITSIGNYRTFEADLPFAHRFEIDQKIGGFRFYKLKGRFLGKELTQASKNFLVESFKPLELEVDPFDILKILSFDLEIETEKGKGLPHPSRNRILSIGISIFGKESFCLTLDQFDSEIEMIQKFIEIIREADPDIITGFNIINFDLKYLDERISVLNKNQKTREKRARLAISRDNVRDKIKFREGHGGKKTIESRALVAGRIILDTGSLTRKNFSLNSYTLKNISEHLLSTPKLDLTPSEINEAFQSNMEKLIEYNIRDAELPLLILKELNLLLRYSQLSRLLNLNLDSTLYHGPGYLVSHCYFVQFQKNNRLVPTKERLPINDSKNNFQKIGALVLDPTKSFFHNVGIFDFASLYPSIIIKNNISPDSLLLFSSKEQQKKIQTPNGSQFIDPEIYQGIIPKFLKNLIEERNLVKRKIKELRDQGRKKELDFLDAKQNSLKIIANSFYGSFGWEQSRLFDIRLANAITSTGRDILTKTKDLIEGKLNKKVIYGDSIGKNELLMLWKNGKPLVTPIQNVFANELKEGSLSFWRGTKEIVKCSELECLSWNPKRDLIERKRVTNIIRHWKPKIFQIKDSLGTFQATGNHAILNSEKLFESIESIRSIFRFTFSLDPPISQEKFKNFDWSIYKLWNHLVAGNNILKFPNITTAHLKSIYNDLRNLIGENFLTPSIWKQLEKEISLNGFFKFPESIYNLPNKSDRINYLKELKIDWFTKLINSNLVLTHDSFKRKNQIKIIHKEEVDYNDFVYDLQVPDNENFFDIWGRVFHNTDSCWVELEETTEREERDKEIQEIKNSVEKLTGLGINCEGIIKTGILIAKKRYALLFDSGEIKTKGIETIRRDWAPIVNETIQQLLNLILVEQKSKEAKYFIRDQIKKIQTFDISKDDPTPFILTRKITKDPKKYKTKPGHIVLFEKLKRRRELDLHIGDRIEFLVIDGQGQMKNRCETVEFARIRGLKIDRDYYIHHQILPPVMRILNIFSISTEELLNDSIQQRLF